jgi:hypothetical protein
MGRACSFNGRDEICICNVDEITGMCEPVGRWGGNVEMDHWVGTMDWNHVAQYRYR